METASAEAETFNPDTQLADRLSVVELVAVYEQAEAGIRAGFAQVAGALANLNGAFSLASDYRAIYLRGGRGYDRGISADWEDPSDTILELRRSIWSFLIERMQVRKAMSIAAWDALQKEIKDGEPPAVTVENVVGMLAKFQHDIPDMLKAAIGEVFDFLRPRGSKYKTNTEFEIGEKVVLSGSYISRGYGRSWDVNYHYQQNLLALENVFYMVDGRVRTEASSYYGKLTDAIKAMPLSGPCAGETEMFAFKGFKNGNLHLRFRRMDLVKKLNAIAGGARLKPAQ